MTDALIKSKDETAPMANVVCFASTRLGGRRQVKPATPSGADVLRFCATVETVDPLLDTILAYNAERKRFNEADNEASDEMMNADAVHMHRLFDRLVFDTPECRSAAGVRAARLLIAEHRREHISDLPGALEEAIAAYQRSKPRKARR